MKQRFAIGTACILACTLVGAVPPPGGNNGRISQASLDMDTGQCETFFQEPVCASGVTWDVEKRLITGPMTDPDGAEFEFEIIVSEGDTIQGIRVTGSILLTNSGGESAVLSSIVANLQEEQLVPNPSGNLHTAWVTIGSGIQVESEDCQALNEARTCYDTFAGTDGADLLLLDPLSNDVIALSDVLPIPASRPDDPLTDFNESCFDAVQIDFVAFFDAVTFDLNLGDEIRVEILSTFGSAGRRGNSPNTTSCTLDANCNGVIDEDDAGTILVDEGETRNIRTIQQRVKFQVPDCEPSCEHVTLYDPGATVDDPDCVGLDNQTPIQNNIGSTGNPDVRRFRTLTGEASCIDGVCGATVTNTAHLDGNPNSQPPGACAGLIDLSAASASFDVSCTGQDPEMAVGDFNTFTQFAYGQGCRPSTPATKAACVRHDFFDCTWPSLFIGEQQFDGPPYYAAGFTSRLPVERYLPALGPVGTLTADLSNPRSSSAGEFGGQVLALSMNIGFSCLDTCNGEPAFVTLGLQNSSSLCLGELVLCGGTRFDGLTVDELLDVANSVLSGDVYALGLFGATLQELNDTVESVNVNFINAQTNNGKLCRP